MTFTLGTLREARHRAIEIGRIRPTPEGHYVMVISDWARAVLVMIEAKARWKARYRAERIVRGRTAE